MSMRLGAHVSISGGVEKAVEREKNESGDCGQIFAGSPRTWKVSTYTEEDGKKFQDARQREDQSPYVIHSTYLVNLATPKEDLHEKSINCLQSEIDAAEKLGIEYVVFHPGAHTGAGREKGIKNIAEGIDELEIPEGVTLLLENTAGKGTTLGKTMGELREIMEKSDTNSSKLGVCIDTCHAHSAGYEFSDKKGFEDFIKELKEDIGLDKVKIIHLNDSKDEKGSEKDNHEDIGYGKIGEKGFENILNSDDLEKIPMILETPNNKLDSYKENINKLKNLKN